MFLVPVDEAGDCSRLFPLRGESRSMGLDSRPVVAAEVVDVAVAEGLIAGATPGFNGGVVFSCSLPLKN